MSNTPKDDSFANHEVSPNGKCLSLSQEPIASPSVSKKRKRANSYEPPSSSFSTVSPSKTIAVKPPNARKEVDFSTEGSLQVVVPQELSKDGKTEVYGKKKSIMQEVDDTGPEFLKTNGEILRRNKSRTRKSLGEGMDVGSSDVDLGPPMEQYQPRPSRSRSGRGNEDLITQVDFSKRPEKVGRKSRKAKVKSEIYVEANDEHHEKDDDGKTTSLEDLKNHSRSEKQIASEVEGMCNDLEEEGKSRFPSTEREPNGQPQKKTRGRPKKTAKPEKDNFAETTDVVKEKLEVAPDAHTFESASIQKGQGEDTSTRKEARTDEDKENRIPPSGPTMERKDSIQESATDGLSAAGFSKGKLPSSPQGKKEAGEPETPSKSSAGLSKGPAKHSPISSSKVSYRVGLSKRARIEPLLRVVRK